MTCATACWKTVRQYAQRKLAASGDAERVRQRHAQHYQARLIPAGPLLWVEGMREQSGRWGRSATTCARP